MNLSFLKVESLKARMTLSTLVIFLIAMWSLSYYATTALRQDILQISGQQQLSVVTLLADQINGELDDRLQMLKTVAQEVKPVMFARTATLQAFLQEHHALLHAFNGGVFITAADGTAVADLPLASGRIGTTYIDRTSVSIPLRKGLAMVGQPAMGKKLGAPIFSISAPIQDENGKVLGVLVGTVNLGMPNFLDKLMHSSYGNSGDYLLAARDSRLFVAATDKRRVLQIAGTSPASKRLLDGYEGTDVFVNSYGVEVLVSGKIVPVANWYLAASLPTVEALAPIQQMRLRMLLATLLLSTFACALTWWLLRRQLFPILIAVEKLSLMADASTPLAPLPVPPNTEVAELVGGFNRVFSSLRQREVEIAEAGIFRKAIIDAVSAHIAVLNEQGQIIEVNTHFRRLSEANSATPEVAVDAFEVGSNYLDTCRHGIGFTNMVDATQAVNGIQAVLDQVLPIFSLEYRWNCQGEQRWSRIVATPLGLRSGGVVVTHNDISDSKRATEKEHSSHQVLQAILNTTTDGFIRVGLDNKLRDVNQQYCSLSGYSREELFCLPVSDLSKTEPSDRAAKMQSVVQHGYQQMVAVQKRKDGTLWDVEVSASYLDVDGGQIVAFLRDISGRRQAEADMLSAKVKAELSDKAKTRFIAAVSHDLRQPLAALSLYVEMLNPNAPVRLAELLPRIKDCTNNLGGLLGNLLDLTRLQSGSVIPILTDIPVADVLKTLQSVHEVSAAQKGLRFRVRPCQLTMRTDGTLMHRLLGNLVANAIQYTNHGGVLIACRHQAQKYWLEVYDTGIGIAEDQIENAFGEFTQLNRNGGSGLGLYIVKKSADLLGLQVRVLSVVGRGSKFAIELPIAEPSTEASQTVKMPELAKLRIALVDDNTMVLDAMTLALEQMGHAVISATTSTAAIARLEGQAPDLLVTDYHLADGKTGADAVEDVRAIFGKALPALILTADTDKSRMASIAREGIAVLYKPVQVGALRAAIEKATGRSAFEPDV